MKKLFLIFVALIMVSPAFAEFSKTDADKSIPVSAYYVKSAYEELNTAKQAKLTSSNVVTPASSGPVVTAVTASNGVVTVTKSEITVPVGSASSPTDHATIWIQ